MAEQETKPTSETHITIFCHQASYTLAGADLILMQGPNNVEMDTWMSWARDNSMRSIIRTGGVAPVTFNPDAPPAKPAHPSVDRARFMS